MRPPHHRHSAPPRSFRSRGGAPQGRGAKATGAGTTEPGDDPNHTRTHVRRDSRRRQRERVGGNDTKRDDDTPRGRRGCGRRVPRPPLGADNAAGGRDEKSYSPPTRPSSADAGRGEGGPEVGGNVKGEGLGEGGATTRMHVSAAHCRRGRAHTRPSASALHPATHQLTVPSRGALVQPQHVAHQGGRHAPPTTRGAGGGGGGPSTLTRGRGGSGGVAVGSRVSADVGVDVDVTTRVDAGGRGDGSGSGGAATRSSAA